METDSDARVAPLKVTLMSQPQLPDSVLSPDNFSDFVQRIHGHPPFRWQKRLAERVCHGDWPEFIKLPTSSGKTSCIDIAIFALAHQASAKYFEETPLRAPRRIFFVVDRRVIVDEAFQRATSFCEKLAAAETSRDMSDPVCQVARWLQSLAGNINSPPLDCFELRGGIYRDDAWVRSLLQPTVLTSTVDQFGSRLLFRGYGVSDRNLPIHAALVSNDSLVLLDEAHCSKPFSETLEAMSRYRDAGLQANETARWAEQPIRTPFHFAQMTATPGQTAVENTIFTLEEDDYKTDKLLEQRHACAKPVTLLECNAAGPQQYKKLAKELVAQAKSLAQPAASSDEAPCRRIAIVVNRVACATESYALLRNEFGDHVDLMIGRMRPTDRDELTKKLQGHFRSDPQRKEDDSQPPRFVVATQCLEVGADFDFDGMVSQCASLDALRQRYGRLNRLGQSPHARGVIVMSSGDLKPKKPDPIYGKSLPKTWDQLQKWARETTGEQDSAHTLNFGIRAMDNFVEEMRVKDSESLAALSAPSPNAPVLMPAHLDVLCQTSPRPAIEPDIANYLHGPDRGIVEVRICWRADLPEEQTSDEEWSQICLAVVAVCPPSSSEVLSVPLQRFREWLHGNDSPDETGDVTGEETTDESISRFDEVAAPLNRRGILWTGADQRPAFIVSAKTSRSIRPNDMIVLPVTAGGWNHFGHVPNAPYEPPLRSRGDGVNLDEDQRRTLARMDIADAAFRRSRARTILRVHPSLITSDGDKLAFRGLWQSLEGDNLRFNADDLAVNNADNDSDRDDHESTATSELTSPIAKRRTSLHNTVKEKGKSSIRDLRYPGGLAVIGPREATTRDLPRASFDDDFDEHNLDADDRLSLADHLADVADETRRLVSAIALDSLVAEAVVAAAERHDLGKADPRFQAMLLNSTPDMAFMQPKLWAKSAKWTGAKRTAGTDSRSHKLPAGFRHEMLSLVLAERSETPLDDDHRDVMLHTIAAHHGHARPFAPVVVDDEPAPVRLSQFLSGSSSVDALTLSADERSHIIPHQLDSGIAERFWNLNRRFGWWGLAWVESSLRLADWTASAQPNTKVTPAPAFVSAARTLQEPTHELPCPGLNAANPLGFLAGLGLLRTASAAWPDRHVRLKWASDGNWSPVLVLSQAATQDELIEALQEALAGRENDAHFIELGKDITVERDRFRKCALAASRTATMHDRTTTDFYAAFGTDGLVSKNDGITIQDTAMRTMAGAGHQHFLETMRNVICACQPEHLHKTLFHPWQYDDATQTLSLRFDPLDDNRYALRWRNPSGDPDRKKNGSMLGANRLAIEALPFFTTVPGPRHTQTAGFTGFRSSDTFLSWPIWTVPAGIGVVKSILTLSDLQDDSTRSSCFHRGIVEVLRSQRVTIGKVRNFTPACSVVSRSAT